MKNEVAMILYSDITTFGLKTGIFLKILCSFVMKICTQAHIKNYAELWNLWV